MTIVSSAIDALSAALGSEFGVEFLNTGGGCMAIEVYRVSSSRSEEMPYVLITDGEDVFSGYDWHSDEYVCGFLATLNPTGGDCDNPEELFFRSLPYVGTGEDDAFVGGTVNSRRTDVLSLIPSLVESVKGVASRL